MGHYSCAAGAFSFVPFLFFPRINFVPVNSKDIMTAFEELKEICRVACHERNACENGFRDLMQAETIDDIIAVWRRNWQDIFDSKFADIMVANIIKVYETSRGDFNRNQVWVNESSDRGLIIVSHAPQAIFASGTAKAYIFAESEVVASDNAQVYCRTPKSRITLRQHSFARIDCEDTKVKAFEFSRAQGVMTIETHNACEVSISGGTLTDLGHRRITAQGTAVVISDTTRSIDLSGEATIRQSKSV